MFGEAKRKADVRAQTILRIRTQLDDALATAEPVGRLFRLEELRRRIEFTQLQSDQSIVNDAARKFGPIFLGLTALAVGVLTTAVVTFGAPAIALGLVMPVGAGAAALGFMRVISALDTARGKTRAFYNSLGGMEKTANDETLKTMRENYDLLSQAPLTRRLMRNIALREQFQTVRQEQPPVTVAPVAPKKPAESNTRKFRL